MIIAYVSFWILCMAGSCMFGFALGFGEGYETRMLERMSKKKRNEYLINKNVMQSMVDKHSRYEI